jgi:hypothetical protein
MMTSNIKLIIWTIIETRKQKNLNFFSIIKGAKFVWELIGQLIGTPPN